MKINKRVFVVLLSFIITVTSIEAKRKVEEINYKVEEINYVNFIDKVWDFDTYQDTLVLRSKVPVIIDFYAVWCGPCKQISPILEKLQGQYSSKIQVYKVDTDKERNLSSRFGIRYLPTLLFIPIDSSPFFVQGLQSEEYLNDLIKIRLLKE